MSNHCDKLASLTEIPIDSNISPALNQGVKFKEYQNNFLNHLDKNSISTEGFEIGDFFGSENINKIPGENVLATQTNVIVNKNNFLSAQNQINVLREQYNDRMIKFKDLMAKIKL